MSALSKARNAGFAIRLIDGDKIGITPVERLTDTQKQWLSEHRGDVLTELRREAANESANVDIDLRRRWVWFLSLAIEHGIHPDVAGAEFPTDSDRLDVIRPDEHNDDVLRACMATLCCDLRVRERQCEYEAGRWVPVNSTGLIHW